MQYLFRFCFVLGLLLIVLPFFLLDAWIAEHYGQMLKSFSSVASPPLIFPCLISSRPSARRQCGARAALRALRWPLPPFCSPHAGRPELQFRQQDPKFADSSFLARSLTCHRFVGLSGSRVAQAAAMAPVAGGDAASSADKAATAMAPVAGGDAASSAAMAPPREIYRLAPLYFYK